MIALWGNSRRLATGVAAGVISRSWRGCFASAILAAGGVLGAAESASKAAPSPGAEILQDLKRFGTVATLLHVGAHPDDENTQLITYFARGRGYRAAYLSLTRGDGGQNEIGPEFDEKLGVARTQELLAARRLDGGRQFFTRAIDFGFSKTPEETLTFWDRQQVLGDVVRVIRQFRPDVVVTRFPIPPGSGGHGHHTASGILAVEAFKLAGDPKAYPEQLRQGLTVWQPKRVVWNGFGSGRGGGGGLSGPTVRVDIGGNDPVTGEAFGVIAARSRGMHITQGFGGFGGRGSGGAREETFTHLGGSVAEKDLFDGVDTSWARVAGGESIGAAAAAIVAAFKPEDPASAVPALLELREQLARLPFDPVVADKRVELDRILTRCLGLEVASRAAQPEVVPGEMLAVTRTVSVRGPLPVILVRVGRDQVGRTLPAGGTVTLSAQLAVPRDTAFTQPYWLREEGAAGIFRVDDPQLIGSAENVASFADEYVFEVSGRTLVVTEDLVHAQAGPKGERRRRVDVIPPVSLRFAAEVSLFTPGARRTVTVDVLAARAGATGRLELALPKGWSVQPASQPFQLAAVGDRATLRFEVTAPAQVGSGRMTATAEVGGQRYAQQRIEINYPHIPLQLLQPPAKARLLCADVAVRGKRVGYLAGAGDDTASALEQLGYAVTMLSGADLVPEKLAGLDAVVIGVRAFNERRDLTSAVGGLWKYVEEGGTVIAQYNRPNGLRTETLGPYALSIQGSAPQLRVTDETAPVTVLAPEHPALTTPNRIAKADFDGWVQERGAYFPSTWDKDHYQPIFAMSDPGEAPLQSSVLVARHGKGYYVYTGLAFFRQLPAGVPGAYRLFANLVSLGK